MRLCRSRAWQVVLQSHVAAVLIGEKLTEGPELAQALSDLLHRMAKRTRRPIRFLAAELTRPTPPKADAVDENHLTLKPH